MITTAVIMAAGMGTRFGKYTEMIPKGFVEFKDKAMVITPITKFQDPSLCGRDIQYHAMDASRDILSALRFQRRQGRAHYRCRSEL